MQVIFDNLSAIVIGSAIFLTLAAVHQRSQVAAVEASLFYSLKQQQLSFIDLLQHDFNAAVGLSSTSVDPVSGTFQFETRPDPSSTAVRTVTYTQITATRADGTVYTRVARYVDGAESGSSAAFVTGWNVQVLNGEGRFVGSAVDGREIAVRLELTYPVAIENQTIRKAEWEMTFRPPVLQQNTII